MRTNWPGILIGAVGSSSTFQSKAYIHLLDDWYPHSVLKSLGLVDYSTSASSSLLYVQLHYNYSTWTVSLDLQLASQLYSVHPHFLLYYFPKQNTSDSDSVALEHSELQPDHLE
ncbi:hypothetical protein Tco_1293234 [Tanacetum coccineum]